MINWLSLAERAHERGNLAIRNMEEAASDRDNIRFAAACELSGHYHRMFTFCIMRHQKQKS